MNQSRWRPQLTAEEKRLGWVFFALYLFLFPFLMAGVVRILDEGLEVYLTPAQSNAIYYFLVLALLTAGFWEFSQKAAAIFVEKLQENLLALALAAAGGLALTCLVSLLPLPVANPVLTDYPQQFALSPKCTLLVVVLLRPCVEEILYRGLLFGSLRKWNRPLAYAVSAGLFALGAVWQYAFPGGQVAYLALLIQYLPLGLALTWAYDIGGSVLTPMAARVLMSAAFLALSLR